MKVIVSFTTSPCRINKTKIMIDSILNQTRKPDYFLLNIPKIFPRTGKSYDIPDFIKDNDNITVNVIDRDFGPATKVIPTLQFIKDNDIDVSETRIIYVDDDIEQFPEMINTFLKYSKNENVVLGSSGFNFRYPLQYNNHVIIYAERKHLTTVSVIEGYGAVCLSPTVFKSDFMEYFNYYSKFKHCLLSDDVILSNYYNMNKKICVLINTPKVNARKLFIEKRVLEYGNLEDALHNNDGNIKKYRICLDILKKTDKLHLQITKLNVMSYRRKGKRIMNMAFNIPSHSY